MRDNENRIQVEIWVPEDMVEAFTRTGQTPPAWSQQAVTEAVRAALKEERLTQ